MKDWIQVLAECFFLPDSDWCDCREAVAQISRVIEKDPAYMKRLSESILNPGKRATQLFEDYLRREGLTIRYASRANEWTHERIVGFHDWLRKTLLIMKVVERCEDVPRQQLFSVYRLISHKSPDFWWRETTTEMLERQLRTVLSYDGPLTVSFASFDKNVFRDCLEDAGFQFAVQPIVTANLGAQERFDSKIQTFGFDRYAKRELPLRQIDVWYAAWIAALLREVIRIRLISSLEKREWSDLYRAYRLVSKEEKLDTYQPKPLPPPQQRQAPPRTEPKKTSAKQAQHRRK